MLRELALQAMIVTMMLAVGLQLSLAEIGAGLRRRGLICLAVLANVVVTPALALAVSELLALPGDARVGLLVCAAAPGGPTGPVFARLARADLGLATALQVLLATLALVSAPLTLELLGRGADGPPLLGPMAATLAVFQLLPLTLGLLLRRWRPAWARRLAAPVGTLANALLLAVVIGLVLTRGAALGSQGPAVHAALLLLVTLPLVLGAWPTSAALRSRLVAVGLVTAVRNMSLALLLSAGFFARVPAVDAVILVWSFYMLVIPGLLAWWHGRGAPP